MNKHFDREAAISEMAAKEKLAPELAALLVDPNPDIQAANLRELRRHMEVASRGNVTMDTAVEELRREYEAARDERDIARMVRIKHALANQYGFSRFRLNNVLVIPVKYRLVEYCEQKLGLVELYS